nr:immunoglobulin light chain junction region [Macaca mulatta]MOV72310.1 immunoglobulin light chain junction region [Macaca mulatta]MOV72577.1 immunoglobulin light chain junction region [Macaca mulatta]MOV72596.1 immunoglobulin light chain junction region [Macaca mulatta]MOV72666.1 immunoglobulin light chain junction region [Macaca mulatta]
DYYCLSYDSSLSAHYIF